MKRYSWINTTSLFNELLEQAKPVNIDTLPNTADLIGSMRMPNGRMCLYQMPNTDLLSLFEETEGR